MLDRTKPPGPGAIASFELPGINHFTLKNGLEIYHVRIDKLPIVQLVVLSSAGCKYDPSEKNGLSFLTSLLIDEGAEEYDALQLNNELEKLGTVLSIAANHDTFSFSLLSLTENFFRSYELLSKILIQPHLDKNDFSREKKKVLDKILQLKEEPSFIASAAFDKLIFDNTYYAYSEIGYDQTVRQITNDDVKLFFTDYFQTSDKKLIVVGNVSERKIIELTEKYLGDLKSRTINDIKFKQPAKTKTKYFFVHKEDSAQSEIRVGHIAKKRISEDHDAIRIMNTILGGQFTSRINLNLRERKGFTYGANSSFNYFQDTGYFEVSTAVNIKNTGEAINEIIKELHQIRETITDEEINFAKSFLMKQFPSRFETYTQVAKNILPLIIHSLPIDYYKTYLENLNSTTNKEIREAAVNNIFPDDLVILAVGDRKEVSSQLKNISGNEPTELDIYGNKIL